MRPRLLACVAGAVCLAGCSSVSTDPHTGGLMGGIHGITTGAYAKRIDDKQAEVADLEAAGEALGQRVGDAQQRLKSLDRMFAERTSKLARLKSEIAEIDRLIAAGKLGMTAGQGTLASIETDNARKDEILRPLQAERDTLARMIQELEQNHIVEAQNYQRMRSPSEPGKVQPGSSSETQMADIEKRLQESVKTETAIEMRIDRAKRDAQKAARTG